MFRLTIKKALSMTTKSVLMCGLFVLAGSMGLAAAETEEPKPAPWVGNWQLVSGERSGVKMDEARTGAYFTITKDTITGMNVEGEVLSLLTYKVVGEQTPAPITLTTEKPFAGETRDAIIGVKDGKLLICYNLDTKGRPKDFVTNKEGNNDRFMAFVPSDDPREVITAIKALSEKKWLAFRDEDGNFFNAPPVSERMTFIGRDGLLQNRGQLVTDLWFENGREEPPPGVSSPEPFYKPRKKDPNNMIDAVKISEQKLRLFGDTVIETGRSLATRANQEAAVWNVRYTSVWVRDKKKQWQLMSDQHTNVK